MGGLEVRQCGVEGDFIGEEEMCDVVWDERGRVWSRMRVGASENDCREWYQDQSAEKHITSAS